MQVQKLIFAIQHLGLRLPGRCLELLKKEESGRTQVSKRKRSDEYRRGTAKRRGEAKTEAEIDTLTSKLTGQQYYKQKQLWTDSSINIHDREALVRNIVNEKELDGKRSMYSKSVHYSECGRRMGHRLPFL